MRRLLFIVVSCLCASIVFAQPEVYDTAEVMPSFKEGSVNQWIFQNLKYPAIAAENGIQGRVIVNFIVEKDGSISNVQVLRSVDPSLDREAVRVVRLMPNWNPGKRKGKKVRVRFTLPVTFKLTSGKKQDPAV